MVSCCELDRRGIRCFIAEMFVDELAHADDIVLIAPTSRPKRRRRSTCNEFADNYFSTVFNAEKLKSLLFEPSRRAGGFIARTPVLSRK